MTKLIHKLYAKNWLKYYVKRGERGLINNWHGEHTIWAISGLKYKTCAQGKWQTSADIVVPME